MAQQKPKSKKESGFSLEEMTSALHKAKDDLDLAKIPFILGGTTLKWAMGSTKTGKEISLITQQKYLTRETTSALKAIIPDLRRTSNYFRWTIGLVPVKLKIVRQKYSFLDNPRDINFAYDNFMIPNPPIDYIKRNGMIR